MRISDWSSDVCSSDLVVPAQALDVAEVQEAQAKPPIAIRRGKPHQPVGDPGILLARLGLVAVAGLADLEGLAGMPDAGASAFDRGSGHLPAQRWHHHFFESASLSRSALSWASASIFFSRRFSSSSSFIRPTMAKIGRPSCRERVFPD